MSASDSPRNYIELSERTPPAKIKKVFGMACGVVPGFAGESSFASKLLLFFMMILPVCWRFNLWIHRKGKL